MDKNSVLMVYSSKTGNTEKVAKEIQKVVEACPEFSLTFCKIEDAPDPANYDAVIAGFWIDKGEPNKEAMEYIKKVQNKKTAFFFTLGAFPGSDHAKKCLEETSILFESQGNDLMGTFYCQGKIDEKLIEAFKSFPKDHPHAYSEESAKRYAIAASHPDEEDLRRARETFQNILGKLKTLVE